MTFAPPPRPYPPSRYEGTTGEVAGEWHRPDDPHDIDFPGGGWSQYLATGAGTDGDFGLYRWHMSGPVSGPDPHFHRTMTESFFVVSGEIDLHDGTDWKPAHAGDFLFVPPGGVHGFRNNSGRPAEMLILFTPGGPRERYFEGLAELATADPRPSDAELAAFFLAHDNIWLDPPA